MDEAKLRGGGGGGGALTAEETMDSNMFVIVDGCFDVFTFEEDMKENDKKTLTFVLLLLVHIFCYHMPQQ